MRRHDMERQQPKIHDICKTCRWHMYSKCKGKKSMKVPCLYEEKYDWKKKYE